MTDTSWMYIKLRFKKSEPPTAEELAKLIDWDVETVCRVADIRLKYAHLKMAWCMVIYVTFFDGYEVVIEDDAPPQ